MTGAAEAGSRSGSSTAPAPRGLDPTDIPFIVLLIVLTLIGLLISIVRILLKAVLR